MQPKIKKNQMYYLVLHKRDWAYKPAVIVPVKAIKREHQSTDWYIVEHEVDGFKYRLTVNTDWLAPYDIEKAKALLYNTKQWEHRWSANGWRFRLNSKTAHDEIMKAVGELSKAKQAKIWKQFKQVYPECLKSDCVFKTSKMQRKHWLEFSWAIIALKYPLKQIW